MTEEFYPGDRVEFIDDKTQGTVVALIDRHQLVVTLDNGLTVPVLKTQIVKVASQSFMPKSLEEKYISPLPETSIKPSLKKNDIKIVFLADDKQKNIDILLLNSCEDDIFYVFYQQSESFYNLVSKGELKAYGQILLKKYQPLKNDELSSFSLTILRHANMTAEIPKSLIFNFKLDMNVLCKKKEFVRELNQEAFVVHLYKKEIAYKDQKIEQQLPEKKAEIKVEKPSEIIDLHIEKINEHHQTMTRMEILDYQFSYFVGMLEKAHAFGLKRLIVIHGIGAGTLRKKITEYCKKQDFIREIKEADVYQFGYGATEIVFK